MTAFADAGDLQNRWPLLPDNAFSQADTLLEDASYRLRMHYPGLDAQIASGAMDPTGPRIVVCNMVKRAMTSTLGVTQESGNTGPYRHSVTYANPNGNLYITADDDELIRGYLPAAVSLYYRDDT